MSIPIIPIMSVKISEKFLENLFKNNIDNNGPKIPPKIKHPVIKASALFYWF